MRRGMTRGRWRGMTRGMWRGPHTLDFCCSPVHPNISFKLYRCLHQVERHHRQKCELCVLYSVQTGLVCMSVDRDNTQTGTQTAVHEPTLRNICVILMRCANMGCLVLVNHFFFFFTRNSSNVQSMCVIDHSRII